MVNVERAHLETLNKVIESEGLPVATGERPRVAGKFLAIGGETFHVRGVTYGTFKPDPQGHRFPPRTRVEEDFALISAHGLNAVRTYTVPPRWLLDEAQAQGLRVMVGLPWDQHLTFLTSRRDVRSVVERVQEGVRACAGHPAILCYAIGNEIPGPIVRWHGRRAIERFLARLYHQAKQEDPEGLFTYVNYPPTEYLQLPFLDIFSFNVYLETRRPLDAYLARLQNLAGDRPVLMAEIGLDSQRHGPDKQAQTLDWQVRTVFAGGAAGAFVFAWTDEWHRGGHAIEDWDFGLTSRAREPKPALTAVREAFAEVPFPTTGLWPKISVVVCTHNGARTLRRCLQGLRKLDYPDYEIILVDDGSTDQSASMARDSNVRLISVDHQGLSAARNAGLKAAQGEIVAYIDDDAFPDQNWLTYLAVTFRTTNHAAVGGPNVAPPDEGLIADCVDNAPGGPVHVLFNDREAEHIPGCNMAFRRSCLEQIGGFDAQFKTAGDDVDVCWRILQQRWTIGFNPAAMVWHFRRSSVSAYWRQQQGYGKAEALLERKWPEKYNALGHVRWAGQIYGKGLSSSLFKRQYVYHGPWGSSSFQALHESSPGLFATLPTLPEWYLVVIALAGLSGLALLWPKLILALPLLVLAGGATLWQAVLSTRQATFSHASRSRLNRCRLHLITTGLHLALPLARLWGRVRHGLTAWRWRLPRALLVPYPRKKSIWRETWHAPLGVLKALAEGLRKDGAVLLPGGAYDRWDFEIRGGMLGATRLLMTVEEHGAGKQFFHFKFWPRFNWEGLAAIVLFAGLSVGAALDGCWGAYYVLAAVTIALLGRTLSEAAGSMAAAQRVLSQGIPETSSALAGRDVLTEDNLTPEPFSPESSSNLGIRSEAPGSTDWELAQPRVEGMGKGTVAARSTVEGRSLHGR